MVPIVYEVGRAPLAVWTGAENLVLIGIRSPFYPPYSDSLYGLRYAGRHSYITVHADDFR